MDRVEVGRYSDPSKVGGWLGWVGTRDWIAFQHEDGRLHVFNGRAENGGVLDAGVVIES